MLSPLNPNRRFTFDTRALVDPTGDPGGDPAGPLNPADDSAEAMLRRQIAAQTPGGNGLADSRMADVPRVPGVVGALMGAIAPPEDPASPMMEPVTEAPADSVAAGPVATDPPDGGVARRDDPVQIPEVGERPVYDLAREKRADMTALIAALAGGAEVLATGEVGALASVAHGIQSGARSEVEGMRARHAARDSEFVEYMRKRATGNADLENDFEQREAQVERSRISQDGLTERSRQRYAYLGEQAEAEAEAERLDERVEVAVGSGDASSIVSALLDRDPQMDEAVATRFAAERIVDREYDRRGMAATAAKKEADVVRVRAQIEADRARARAQGSLAGKYDAEADLKRRTDPNTRRRSSPPPAPASAELSAQDRRDIEAFVASGQMTRDEADALLSGD